MMRSRQKLQPRLYPHWSRKDSPAKQAKLRDGKVCVDCGVHDRTIAQNAAGEDYYLYLHAAHVSYLDPDPVEPILVESTGEMVRLRARCPRCHGRYDAIWKPREAEAEHEARMHAILLTRWLPDSWLQKRFLEVR